MSRTTVVLAVPLALVLALAGCAPAAAPYVEPYIVDRVEGEYAVVETPSGRYVDVRLTDLLPADRREGAVLAAPPLIACPK